MSERCCRVCMGAPPMTFESELFALLQLSPDQIELIRKAAVATGCESDIFLYCKFLLVSESEKKLGALRYWQKKYKISEVTTDNDKQAE